MTTQQMNVAPAQSHIHWTGRKVTGTHDGSIAIKEGRLNVSNGFITGGHLAIDMSSIKILDITDPATNAQFAGHLASDDFFGIEQHPTAHLTITNAQPGEGDLYRIQANLTMKNITQPIEFEAHVQLEEEILRAQAKLKIDRTLFDIRFRSGNFFKDLGDTLIYNHFELDVQLTAKAIVPEPVL